MLALLDTNVLVYAVDSQAEQHACCRTILSRAAQPDADLCVAPQNLAEFYAVVTDRRRVRNPLAPANAIQVMKQLLELQSLALLTVPIDIAARFMDVVLRHELHAQHAFDAFLAATMLGNGVTRIYTFNKSHFVPFRELEVLVPEA